MNFKEYQELSKRTMPKLTKTMSMVLSKKDLYSKLDKSNYAMGLAGESGETVDLIKKEVHHGHDIDLDKLKKELGDVLHYLSGIATMYGFSLEDVAVTNVEKLRERYPNGFSTKDSVKRVDVHDQ